MTLDQLPVGDSGYITAVGGEGALRCHLLDMGLIPKTKVLVKKVAPMGDPIELFLRGYALTLRKADAAMIEIDGVRHEATARLADKEGKRFGKCANHTDRPAKTADSAEPAEPAQTAKATGKGSKR